MPSFSFAPSNRSMTLVYADDFEKANKKTLKRKRKKISAYDSIKDAYLETSS
jgi:hypothetical protein